MSIRSILFIRWRPFVFVLSMFAGLLVAGSDLGTGVERRLQELDASFRQRKASGALHVVEIDARSIASIDKWPWPRDNYAKVVDQLRQAGAASIAFDVDFSSSSDPEDDAALAASLRRASGKVILPTFGQLSGSDQEEWTDSLPIPILRENSALAAVTIRPDDDGYVRNAPMGAVTRGTARPSLSAILAGASGAAGSEFPIDFAITPASVPRHSFIDIRDGRFDPRQIAGKDVLIGATAIELGDRYAVPNHGVIAGVVIQALAAETLAHGVPRQAGWLLPLIMALACTFLILRLRLRSLLVAALASAPLAIFAASVVARARLNWIFELAPALTVLVCAGSATVTMQALGAAYRRRSHDVHTGLPNRLALRDAAGVDCDGLVAARFSDFDKLLAALGTQVTGDLVSRVYDRICSATEGSTVYRIEDRVLVWRWSHFDLLQERITALRAMMLNPIEVAGKRIDVALAFGVAIRLPEDGTDETLAQALMAADHALASGEAWHVHDPQEKQTADLELSLLGELDDAIGKGEIEVFYQPKVCLATDAIVGVEALVRWNHATRGFLRPDAFIPLAERNDRIAGLTLYVLERTVEDLSHWHALGHRLTAAVNLSAKLLNSRSFLAALRQLVTSNSLPPSNLTFEVTESAAMTDTAQAVAALQSFRDLGISISMDDYGTGQSTLSYLKQLPLNELKIDRSFVQFSHQNRNDAVLVQSTVNLAHDLGLKVVAEGVEESECLDYLRSIRCDLVQGYLISKPLPAADLEALLSHAEANAA